MKKEEAYNALGLNINSTKEEAKISFKKLAAKYHPDNKEFGNEDRFKEINAAFQSINSEKFDQEHQFFEGNPFGDDLNNFFYQQAQQVFVDFSGQRVHFRPSKKSQPIIKNVTISFSEFALGCTRNISFDRQQLCGLCNKDNFKDCKDCNGIGTKSVINNIMLTVTPGMANRVTAQNAGNADPKTKLFGDVIINIQVTEEPNMEVHGYDIVSVLDVSLLEALKGTNKKVKTVKGEMSLKIKPGVRHMDKLSVKGYGIGNIGSHIFLLDVKYPNDTQKLIDVLDKSDDNLMSPEEKVIENV